MKDKHSKILVGILKFHEMWNSPIVLTTEDGDVDIAPIIYDFFSGNNGKTARQVDTRDRFAVKLMESDKQISYTREYESDELKRFGFSLEVPDGFGFINTKAYLESTLTSLIGRKTILEIDESSLTIRVDDFDDDVPVVYYTKSNSATLVGNYEVKDVCKPGTNDCCIFLTLSADGFFCDKFNGPTARHLLNRHFKGQMNATRLGNCKCNGRWEDLLKIKNGKIEQLSEEEE